MATYTLHHGNNIEVLKQMIQDGVQVDSVVTDPPYGLKFMGKKWDYDVPSVEFWTLVLGVLKPGGHVLSFGGTRTYHRMVVNLEDAGFEIRDQIVWLYGSGFPKSMDVSKAIDKAAGAERDVIGENPRYHSEGKRAGTGVSQWGDRDGSYSNPQTAASITVPATPEAVEWEGWGTALKPAMEPVVLARKPLEEDTVAANVLKYRTGGINVNGCRVETTDNLNGGAYAKNGTKRHDGAENWRYKRTGRTAMPGDERTGAALGMFQDYAVSPLEYVQPTGRFPANVILDEDAGNLLDAQTGSLGSSYRPNRLDGQYPFSTNSDIYGTFQQNGKKSSMTHADSGGASRFFYSAKASKKERRGSKHPTVKPLALMRYLCRLITPPGGTVLDPFAGSGTTGEAAVLEGFHPVMIELEPDYVTDIENRMKDVNGEEELEMPPVARNTATLESLFVD
jgi:DNA modification methylase